MTCTAHFCIRVYVTRSISCLFVIVEHGATMPEQNYEVTK